MTPHSAKYVNGCGCDECRAYQRDRVRRSRQDRLESGRVKHGSSGWDDGCRCVVCTRTHRGRYADYWRQVNSQRTRAA